MPDSPFAAYEAQFTGGIRVWPASWIDAWLAYTNGYEAKRPWWRWWR